ncbi:MAG: 3-phosphoshikimate 1-carboxyvinyltransferase [Chitinophagaceae bacterium]|nr:3-phosphoshikimate 1-carboxyvinyltransferase [Chitinophagaceae bacterium]
MVAIVHPSKLTGSQTAPASKSSMQRACAAALIHIGKTIIHNPGHSNDDLAALEVIQKLGAIVKIEKQTNEKGNTDRIVVNSNGVKPIGSSMNCGESGLGIRMFTPIAALSSELISIEGKGSLLKRPMYFFDEILPKVGVKVQSQKGFLPIAIQGPLIPANITIDGSLSSQFLTGMLMAYAATDVHDVEIKVIDLKSKPYIDLTLAVINAFGWKVEHTNYESFRFLAHAPLKPVIEYTVEGDWSGAAFLLVAGAIAGPIKVKGLQLNSTQADKKIMQALTSAKATMKQEEDGILIGPSADNSNNYSNGLIAFEFDATDCPDLFPPLVALASVCNGTTKIKGVSRLAHKESDRGLTLQTEFAKMGVQIDLLGDEMHIHGGAHIQSATVFSQHDHRIAMACGVAALVANGPIEITEADAINKSYTDFFTHLQELGAKVDIQ